MEEKKLSTGIIVLITTLVIAVIGLTSFIVYDKVIKKDEVKEPIKNEENNSETNKKEDDNFEVSFIDYQYDNLKISMINRVDKVDDIYAVDIMYNEKFNIENGNRHYDLVVRYKDDSKLKVATIYQTNPEVEFEPRTLDVDNGKIYFYVSGNNNTIFELYYINLNNMSEKPQNISKFDEINKAENNYCWATHCETSPTTIFVHNNIIYFVSRNKGIMSYNINTEQLKTIVSDSKEWYNLFVDKVNNKIIYTTSQYGNGWSFHILNFDGTESAVVNGDIINASSDWNRGYYNGFLVFTSITDKNGNKAECYYDGPCYKYSYILNTLTGQFQMIDVEAIDEAYYTVSYNKIISSTDKGIYRFYVGKK